MSPQQKQEIHNLPRLFKTLFHFNTVQEKLEINTFDTPNTKRYILTGTPGCGKTSIIQKLETQGYFVIAEAATDVIAYEQSHGIQEPWLNPYFIDKIIALQKERQLQAASTPVDLEFYDRSPFCTYALSVYLGFEPSSALLEEIERIQKKKIYEQHVFFIENLGYCEPTPARKISFEDSLVFEKIHAQTYAKFGYECVIVPALELNERVETILKLLYSGVYKI